VGNHTIGASALGGMLFGTIFGVFIVPGLYFIFGKLQEGRQLFSEEDETPLSEAYAEEQSQVALTDTIRKMINKITKRNEE
jgi:HAE1 family hydrophobic/amphiphilic exporter-1